jgi:methionyl-tRNA formyltransferase
MDTGDMLLMEKTAIGPEETAADLHDRLSDLGARTLVRTLEKLQDGTLERIPQDHARATYAPMLKKKDGEIDWSLPAERIECLIRGMTPWPGAYTFSNGMRLKIFKACVLEREISVQPGTILECFPGELRVATGRGSAGGPGDPGGIGQTPAHRRFSVWLPPARRPLSGLTGRGRKSAPVP